MNERQTIFDALLASLRTAAQYDRNDQTAPAVVLWTDRDGQWRSLLPRLRLTLPQLLTLGDYDPATKTGPAIWLRAMIARTLPEADWPADTVPILYLPGVSRHNLRAVEDCPRALQPLAELQYRGTFWTQSNTNDWTVRAFLTSPHGGLGLDLARDSATTAALRNALSELADQPIAALHGKQLDADFLNELLIPDPTRDLLLWLDDPDGVPALWGATRWSAFRDLVHDRFGLDPERGAARRRRAAGPPGGCVGRAVAAFRRGTGAVSRSARAPAAGQAQRRSGASLPLSGLAAGQRGSRG